MLQEFVSNLAVIVQEFTNGGYNVTLLLLSVLTIIIIGFSRLKHKRKYKLPPGPYGLPLVGYLPFLGKEPYKVLNDLSKKYGNVFSLTLGRDFVIILGDFTAVKEVFSKPTTTNKLSRSFDFIPDGIGFSSLNGEAWSEQRKFSMRAMKDIGLGRTRWEELVQEEVEDFVSILNSHKGQPIDVNKYLASSVANNISSLVFGKRIPTDNPLRQKVDSSIEAFSRTANQTSLRIFFPLLHKVLVKLNIGEYGKNHRDVAALNDYIKKEVEERKLSISEENSGIFIDEYLKEIKNSERNNSHTSFNEQSLRGNTQAFLIGGSDTMKAALNWLFISMASFPLIQKKVYHEIKTVLGTEGHAQYSERSKVPYTFAVILECQRWMSMVPLNTARVSTEDITVGGYDVPKGTPMIANYWALHNDTKYWKNPEQFIPERFLANDGKEIIYKQDSYVPFSYGKRNCPGETISFIEILLYFTAVVQRFEILPPAGEKTKVEGIMGITYDAVKQELRFIPRNE